MKGKQFIECKLVMGLRSEWLPWCFYSGRCAHDQQCWDTNPLECAAALDKMARKAGVNLKIAVVTGDDIMGEVTDIYVIPPKQEVISCDKQLP